MKLIVGLGNPGKEYQTTRHNIGFMVLDIIKEKYKNIKWNNKFDGLFFDINIHGEKVIFLKPQKYMNLSGEVIKKYVNYYNISLDDILIILDDLDLPVGKFRLRPNGRSAGHNGLKDIFKNLNTEEIKRMKVGIGNNNLYDTKDYVLGHFSKEEMHIIKESLNKVSSIVMEFIIEDFSNLMSKYN